MKTEVTASTVMGAVELWLKGKLVYDKAEVHFRGTSVKQGFKTWSFSTAAPGKNLSSNDIVLVHRRID